MMFANGQQIALVTRTKRPEPDIDGNDVYTETFGLDVGAFAPGSTGEVLNAQTQVLSQPALYLDHIVDLTAIDAIVINPSLAGGVITGGVRYEIDGDPSVWQNPFTGWQPGMQIALKKVTG